jgi:hypothetical protein
MLKIAIGIITIPPFIIKLTASRALEVVFSTVAVVSVVVTSFWMS